MLLYSCSHNKIKIMDFITGTDGDSEDGQMAPVRPVRGSKGPALNGRDSSRSPLAKEISTDKLSEVSLRNFICKQRNLKKSF